MGMLGPTFFAGDTDAPEGILYHYTNNQALKSILASGVLRPHRTIPGDRCALLWFSSNGIWEPAAGRGLAWDPTQPMSFDALAQRAGGLARVLVDADVAPLAWPQLRTLVSPQWVAMLAGPAGSWVRANCHRWFASTKPVSRDFWLGVEVWKSPRWVAMAYSWVQQ